MTKENRADDLRMLLRPAFELTDLAQDQFLMDGPMVLTNIIHDLQQLLERLGGPTWLKIRATDASMSTKTL